MCFLPNQTENGSFYFSKGYSVLAETQMIINAICGHRLQNYLVQSIGGSTTTLQMYRTIVVK